jgi:predicted Fe-Mo cluster-binding NifX family protein
MVIIAVPSLKPGSINSNINPRFGRSEYFTFISIENNEIKSVKAVPNRNSNAMGGAGIQTAEFIGNNGAKEVIAGFLGPNAYQSLNALKIKIYQAPNERITVNDCINLYLKHQLPEMNTSNVRSHHGMGGGGGRGRSR